MTRPRTLLLALPLLLSALPMRAEATHRAGFFRDSPRPSIGFNKGSMTWTLKNGAMQRVLRFDAKAGALATVSVQDTKNGQAVRPVPGSELKLTFAAPLMEAPKPITTGWRRTDATPPSHWATARFDAAAWKETTLPFRAQRPDQTVWLRYAIPQGRLTAQRAYALALDRAIAGTAEIYVDGEKVETARADDQTPPRFVQVDLTPASRVIGIRLAGGDRPGALGGRVSIAEVGSAPPPLDLTSDWRYVLHTAQNLDDGSALLTISLSGLKRYEGLDIDLSYQIFPGDEPFLAKWFSFLSHRASRYLLEKAVVDEWTLPGSAPETRRYLGTAFVAADPESRAGLLTAALTPLGASELGADGKTVAAVLRPFLAVKPNTAQMLPKTLLGAFRGPVATGAFLYQIFTGQYVARATPTSVPTLYRTGPGFGAAISEKLCERLIPLAVDVGAKLFVLDDGWQTNLTPDSGRYGDWVTDRGPDRFPQGLMPTSALARSRNLRFGLWIAPALVNETSQAGREYRDRLLRASDDALLTDRGKSVAMCFTAGWEESFTKSLAGLCREQFVTGLVPGGRVFEPGCVVPTHDHPVSHSLGEQVEHWRAFADGMHRLDPAFTLRRDEERGPEWFGMIDTGGVGTFDAPMNGEEALRAADTQRRRLLEIAAARPGFTLSAEAPCHVPGDLAALEYVLTSAAATAGNLSLSGRLDETTPEERAMVRKWTLWNEENRPWLACAQPLPRAPGAASPIEGMLHLRNALEGRYGYLCLWNPSASPQQANAAFRPSDYFVRLSGDVQIVRLRDGQPVKFRERGGEFALSEATLAPRSWEIYEIRQKSR